MLHGYPLVKKLCGGLQAFMQQHDFTSIQDFKGKAAARPRQVVACWHAAVRWQRRPSFGRRLRAGRLPSAPSSVQS